MLTIDVFNRDRVQIIHSFTLDVNRYDSYAEGGPNSAILEAKGTPEALLSLTRWLGYYIVIRSESRTPVWWGKIDSVTTRYGNLEIGASLKDMFNRVRVLYMYPQLDIAPIPMQTDWYEHDRSVEFYGRKENRHSVGNASTAQAEAAAAKILSESALAQQVLALSADDTAIIKCVGIWQTLDWTYYSQSKGKEAFELNGDTEQAVGWGLTATDIGFAGKKIHKVLGGLTEADSLADGENFRVSGSTSNNGSYTHNGSSGKYEHYQADTISFETPDEIFDSGEGLGFVNVDSFIRITGSSANNGYHLIDESGRSHIQTATTVTGTLTDEAAGATVTIEQGDSIDVEEDFVGEAPGATVTLTGTSKLAYRIQITENFSWQVAEILIRVRKQGNPADNLVVKIYSDSSGSLGSLLDNVSVAGSSLSKRMGWIGLSANRTATVVYLGYYWIVIERSGANSTEDYYAVALDEELSHSGILKVYDGVSWNTRFIDACMPFQLFSSELTSEQIEEILIQEGQFLSGVDNRIDSGIRQREYRDGSNSSIDELGELIDAGTSTGARIIPYITSDWRCIIDVAKSSANPQYRLLPTGEIVTSKGGKLEDGVLPIGEWCEVDGLGTDSDGLAPISPFLIGYCEYNAKQRKITDIKPYGKLSVWDISSILQG